jgi:hypothetical protein
MAGKYPGRLCTPNDIDPNGEMWYCSCGDYIGQTDPKNPSIGKTVLIFQDGCLMCASKAFLKYMQERMEHD